MAAARHVLAITRGTAKPWSAGPRNRRRGLCGEAQPAGPGLKGRLVLLSGFGAGSAQSSRPNPVVQIRSTIDSSVVWREALMGRQSSPAPSSCEQSCWAAALILL